MKKSSCALMHFCCWFGCTAYRYWYYRYLVIDKFFFIRAGAAKKKDRFRNTGQHSTGKQNNCKKGEWNLKVDTPCLVSWNMCVAFHAHLWAGAGWEAAGQPGHTHTIEPSVQYSSIQPLHNNNQHCLVSNGHPEYKKVLFMRLFTTNKKWHNNNVKPEIEKIN